LKSVCVKRLKSKVCGIYRRNMVGFEGKNEVKGRFYASVCVLCEWAGCQVGGLWLVINYLERERETHEEREKKKCACV
jgi:hypothetical protein